MFERVIASGDSASADQCVPITTQAVDLKVAAKRLDGDQYGAVFRNYFSQPNCTDFQGFVAARPQLLLGEWATHELLDFQIPAGTQSVSVSPQHVFNTFSADVLFDSAALGPACTIGLLPISNYINNPYFNPAGGNFGWSQGFCCGTTFVFWANTDGRTAPGVASLYASSGASQPASIQQCLPVPAPEVDVIAYTRTVTGNTANAGTVRVGEHSGKGCGGPGPRTILTTSGTPGEWIEHSTNRLRLSPATQSVALSIAATHSGGPTLQINVDDVFFGPSMRADGFE